MLLRSILLPLYIIFSLSIQAHAQQPTREEKVRADKEKVESQGFWIYNDLDKAFALARQSGKPILVVLRCIPCEECVKLDDELVDTDPVLKPLLEQFVCVRVVSTNGLDLDTFQFDTDQSFAVFMLNADKTIYGRFGTRSHRTEWLGDVSLEGMAKALEGALQLHANYPANQASLAAKRGERLEFATPEQFPAHRERYTEKLDYAGNVVQSCIHCHQIGDARRDFYWNQSQPIPEKLMYPFPHPKSVGLVLDPKHRARVKSVQPDTPTSDAGLQPGDDLIELKGQPLLSIADVQWVLDSVSADGGQVQIKLQRSGSTIDTLLQLPPGWRRNDDISWRVSSWGMRRMTTGGMVLEPLSDQERTQLKLDPGAMALKVKAAGRYGPHAAARQAGFEVDDILLAVDGTRDLLREQDWFSYIVENRKAGDQVHVEFLRGDTRRTLQLPIQH
jgi:serine protease Do